MSVGCTGQKVDSRGLAHRSYGPGRPPAHIGSPSPLQGPESICEAADPRRVREPHSQHVCSPACLARCRAASTPLRAAGSHIEQCLGCEASKHGSCAAACLAAASGAPSPACPPGASPAGPCTHVGLASGATRSGAAVTRSLLCCGSSMARPSLRLLHVEATSLEATNKPRTRARARRRQRHAALKNEGCGCTELRQTDRQGLESVDFVCRSARSPH